MRWTEIKQNITTACQTAYVENGISIGNEDLEQNIQIFINFIQLNSGYGFLDGMQVEFPKVLEDACVNYVGQLKSIKSLATLFDAFAKKILVLSQTLNYGDVEKLGMNALLQKLNIVPHYQLVAEDEIERQKGNPKYICMVAQNTRNNVHSSPNWDQAEILRRQRYVLALYMWVLEKYKEPLLVHKPSLGEKKLFQLTMVNKETRTYYDYITYSSSMQNMRKNLVESFVLQNLYQQEELIIDVVKKIVKFSNGTITEKVANRILDNFITHSPKLHKVEGGKIELTVEGEEYVKNINNDFNTSYSCFIFQVQELITKYQTIITTDQYIVLLQNFLEENITLNIKDFDEDFDVSGKLKYYHVLCEKLQKYGLAENHCQSFIKDSLLLCKQNDILYSLSLGKIANKYSDSSLFAQDLTNQVRTAYFDTQILLYIMCINEDNADWRENVWYQMAKNIINHPNKSRYVFKTFRPYVSEVAYQLAQALSLLPIVDYTKKKNIKISNNIFYNHYYYLASNEGLSDSVNTYEEYLQAMFSLSSDDLSSSDLLGIAEGVVYTKLEESFKLEIDDVAYMSANDIFKVGDIFDKIAVEHKLAPKMGKLRENDILVLLSLFKNQDINNAFSFITWDQTFAPARSLYRTTYKRTSENPFFYIYSPGKFLSQLDFLNFKVDASNLSNELLAMMDDSKSKQKTLMERYNALLGYYNTPLEERKKYLKTIQTTLSYSDDDFTALFDDNEKKLDTFSKDPIRVFDEVMNVVQERRENERYVSLFREEQTFKILLSKIQEYVSPQSSIDSIEKLTEEILKINSSI